VRGTGVHAVMGIGGAPEGVITAAALRCLGGEIQARLAAQSTTSSEAAPRGGGDPDSDRIYSTEDLAPGEQILFVLPASPTASCCAACASSAPARAARRSSCRCRADDPLRRHHPPRRPLLASRHFDEDRSSP
jgi:hypothetical protein